MNGRDGGFTIVELAIVTIILGVLVAVAVASFVSTTATSERVSCRSNQRTLITAVAQYEWAHGGLLPQDLDDLEPYAKSLGVAGRCPSDRRALVYDPTTGDIRCTYPGHQD